MAVFICASHLLTRRVFCSAKHSLVLSFLLRRYVFTVFVTVMYEGRYMDGDAALFAWLGIAGYTFWMCLINTNLDGLFCRQSRIWGGYPYFCEFIIDFTSSNSILVLPYVRLLTR